MSLRQALFLAFGFGSERVIITGFLHITGLISAGKLVHIPAHWIHVHAGSTVGPMFSSLWLGMPLSQGGFSFSAQGFVLVPLSTCGIDAARADKQILGRRLGNSEAYTHGSIDSDQSMSSTEILKCRCEIPTQVEAKKVMRMLKLCTVRTCVSIPEVSACLSMLSKGMKDTSYEQAASKMRESASRSF